MNKEFPPEQSVHLREHKQIILQRVLDGHQQYTEGVLESIKHLQPADGWEPWDLVLLGAFCAECQMNAGNTIPGARMLANEHGLELRY